MLFEVCFKSLKKTNLGGPYCSPFHRSISRPSTRSAASEVSVSGSEAEAKPWPLGFAEVFVGGFLGWFLAGKPKKDKKVVFMSCFFPCFFLVQRFLLLLCCYSFVVLFVGRLSVSDTAWRNVAGLFFVQGAPVVHGFGWLRKDMGLTKFEPFKGERQKLGETPHASDLWGCNLPDLVYRRNYHGRVTPAVENSANSIGLYSLLEKNVFFSSSCL